VRCRQNMKRCRPTEYLVTRFGQACPDGASRGIGVAYEVGFSNLSYFSKVFKEEFGQLPSEFEQKT
jgi:AraC-like DNA-binding protein